MKEFVWIIYMSELKSKDENFVSENLMTTENLTLNRKVTGC